MKNTGIRLFILVLILCESCGRDLYQAKRYSEMKSECDSLIGQINSVITFQRAKADSLRRIRSEVSTNKMAGKSILRIDREIIDVSKIVSDGEMIIKHLEAIKIFTKVGEKVNSRIIYYKRKYINYSTTIQVHDDNIAIQEITDWLSAKQYISKYKSKGIK